VDYIINVTGAPSPPLHSHDQYEIIVYTAGEGVMRTPEREYSVGAGSIVIVPPGVGHGTVSSEAVERLYIRGEFRQIFSFTEPAILWDNQRGEGQQLGWLLYENRFGNREYLHALCTAFARFLLIHLETESGMGRAVNEVIRQLTERFSDGDLSVTELLRGSGYAEDYIRARFRHMTGKTPVEFLTDVRMRHACFLVEFYADTLSLAQIAEQCGYTDYVYFSKKFRKVVGLSPREYKVALETGTFG